MNTLIKALIDISHKKEETLVLSTDLAKPVIELTNKLAHMSEAEMAHVINFIVRDVKNQKEIIKSESKKK